MSNKNVKLTDCPELDSIRSIQVFVPNHIDIQMAMRNAPSVWRTGSKETAVQDRAIPIPELWSRFVRGENIADGRMYREPTFNPIENNPYKRKGLDRADIPDLMRETANMKQTAIAQAEQEIEAYKQSQLPEESEKTVSPSE